MSATSKIVKDVGKGVEKVAQGKVGEGLGDIGETAMRSGLDVATGGNKDLVDGLSGGLMTSAEGAARGNSKDIIRTGLTGFGIVSGANAIGGALNPVGGEGGLSSLVNPNSGGGGIMDGIKNIFSGFTDAGSRSPASSYVEYDNPIPQGSDNQILIIGGGLMLVLITILISRKK